MLGPARSASTTTVGSRRPRAAPRLIAIVVRPGLPGPLHTAMIAPHGTPAGAASQPGEPSPPLSEVSSADDDDRAAYGVAGSWEARSALFQAGMTGAPRRA